MSKKKTFIVKVIPIFIAIFLLYACAGYKKDYNKLEKRLNEINTKCSIDSKTNRGETIWVGSLFYNKGQTKLTNKDKKILDDIAVIYNTCIKQIAIIAHANNNETQDSYKVYSIASTRANNIFNYLTGVANIPLPSVIRVICSDVGDIFITNDTNANVSQRVDIVLLNESASYLYYSCIKE